MPSTSRGGFFRSTMQLHFCAFNIIRALSHIQAPLPPQTRVLLSVHGRAVHTHTPRYACSTIGMDLREGEETRGGEGGWQDGREISKRLGWRLIIILLNRKKGSPAIILPAYDVLSFVCHGHCDIRVVDRVVEDSLSVSHSLPH